MSEITSILEKLEGTREAEILMQMENAYDNVTRQQSEWYQKSGFTCVDGCGECCRNFEPDILESEASYMAAWLLENQPEVAEQVAEGNFPFPREGRGCQFWNENSPYHCSIYFGRAFICRLFGGSCNFDKEGQKVWKPCKFYPAEKLAEHNPPISHRQYNKTEIMELFGTLPPAMSDLMEGAVSINPDNTETSLIRDILPATIRKLKWLCSMNSCRI